MLVFVTFKVKPMITDSLILKKANLLSSSMTMTRDDISILVLLRFRQQFYWLVQYQNNIADGMMVNYQNDLSIVRLFRVDDAIQ